MVQEDNACRLWQLSDCTGSAYWQPSENAPDCGWAWRNSHKRECWALHYKRHFCKNKCMLYRLSSMSSPSAIMHTSLWQMKLITFKALVDSTYQSDIRDIDSFKHIAVSTQITQSKWTYFPVVFEFLHLAFQQKSLEALREDFKFL